MVILNLVPTDGRVGSLQVVLGSPLFVPTQRRLESSVVEQRAQLRVTQGNRLDFTVRWRGSPQCTTRRSRDSPAAAP
jgi:hypothetical protein